MPERLVQGYQRFRDGYFIENKEKLAALAMEQKPRIALLSCCDSRVDPTTVFDAAPGDLFVIRNVANLAPPYEQEGVFHGTSAALEFAVTGLEVSHIVVLGHANCGGIRALMDKSPSDDKTSFIDRWMTIAAPVREHICASGEMPDEERYATCERQAIAHSLRNLMTYPWVKTRVNAGTLSLHGWHYDLAEGTLSSLDPETKSFLPLR
ncbi:carbonic anhydrase [Pseudohalocynthiibacter aestuariivivens]|jgi:carbonic anhydrase|uniref:Carbonic anhydrase n=1 Tax=Pseudohalocynthiibacter aestuariivivens TaxID=1591409 RepID=A0ABV5JCY6_9RHOB|nr:MULTISPECIES: carbonic anhydrase [Pseudohalocynthiibacter]MBS9716058.1 carbonic anhydrase [Pseudohalocynthiibacter aestuariivivens]MCK0102385.1 carbonic anhydrase [Pseudohalocynthiibacter sp. F2068]